MSCVINLNQLEQAIVSCGKYHPPVNGELHPDMDALGEIWGRMLFQKEALADLDKVPALIRSVVLRWIEAGDVTTSVVVKPACFKSPRVS